MVKAVWNSYLQTKNYVFKHFCAIMVKCSDRDGYGNWESRKTHFLIFYFVKY